MKKTKWLIIVPCVVILICATIFIALKFEEDNREIPYIAFMENFDRANCLYICANGDIYASTSEEAFSTPLAELSAKIQREEYADILEFVGTTDAKEVRKMYRLFCSVVLKEGYYCSNRTNTEPDAGGTSGGYENKVRYWSGMYYNDKEKLVTKMIYESKSDKICTDKRAYKIVEWMYECLKDYFDEDVKAEASAKSNEAAETPKGTESTSEEQHKEVLSIEQPKTEREKEPLKDLSVSYIKEATENDIVFDKEDCVYYVRNQLLVGTLLGVPREAVEQLAEDIGADIVGYIELIAQYQLEFREPKVYWELMNIAAYLETFSYIDYANVNFATPIELQ